MDYDTQKAARVWQRVQSEKQDAVPAQRSDNLAAPILEQLQLSAAYAQLARQMQGKDGAVFMRLAREAKMQAVCLKGIMTLMTGQSPDTGLGQQPGSPTAAMLRRCYGQELRLLKEYESRRSDAEYGPVFERLAGRCRDHCCILLEQIGACGLKTYRRGE